MKETIYLDYSATTQVDKSVLETFNNIALNYAGNPNSNHSLGTKAKKIIDEATENICKYFKIESEEIIFTSGASEANNLAIKGVTHNNKRHIITTELEHSSIFGPIGYLQKSGFKIDFVKLNANGTVDLENLKSLITDDTLLVSIGAVDSEIGTRQPIEEIGLLLKKYPDVYFHSDITQLLGKDKIDLTNVDLASFSGHKIYTFKGIGGLIKKKHIKITPLIHGGKSTTVYRSGTPATELIGALSEGFNLFKDTLEEKYKYVQEINNDLKLELAKYSNIYINSSENSIPHILNISIIDKSSNNTQEFMAKQNIFISTKTACASDTNLSKAVLAFTKDEKRASSSVRISLSYRTTKEEINRFKQAIKEYMEEKN